MIICFTKTEHDLINVGYAGSASFNKYVNIISQLESEYIAARKLDFNNNDTFNNKS